MGIMPDMKLYRGEIITKALTCYYSVLAKQAGELGLEHREALAVIDAEMSRVEQVLEEVIGEGVDG